MSLRLAAADVIADLDPDDVTRASRILAIRDMAIDNMLAAYTTALRDDRDRDEDRDDEDRDEEGG